MSDEIKFVTPFGILEEKFVRTVKQGNYCPIGKEILDAIKDGKVTLNEAKIMIWVAEKTIYFRNTHFRVKRRDFCEALGMAQPQVFIALKKLVEEKYLLEKADRDNFYFYALNPAMFNGVIVLRSVSEASYRINHNEKAAKGILMGNMKPILGLYESHIAFILKSYNEDESTIRNCSGIEILKYILLKYILLNGLSALAAERIFQILSEAKNPEFMIIQFVKLLHTQPLNARGMSEELQRAHREKTDLFKRPLGTNAAAYFITCWESHGRQAWNIDHKVDMSPEAVEARQKHYEMLISFPLENNVVELKKRKAQ